MSIAFVFPGQGSQSVGMGKNLYENFSVARDVFHEVDDALNQKLSQLMFEGDSADLTLTANAQPAIMAVSIATLRVIESLGLDIKSKVKLLAGHSLGEYAALCSAGVFSLSDTAKLLRIRGEAMQKAVPQGEGAMAAVLGCEMSDLLETIEKFKHSCPESVCEIANDNGGGQIVISGTKQALDKVSAMLLERGVKRVVQLPVSAPFHCSLMQPAADVMQQALSDVAKQDAKIAVVTNIDVKEATSAQIIVDSLVRQVVGTVRWRETIEYIVTHGITNIYEIGWGKVLTGLVKRITKECTAESIYESEQIEKLIDSI